MSNPVQTAPAAARAGRLDWRILLLALSSFTLMTDSVVIVGVLPQIAQATHVTAAQAGQLVTLFALTYSLGAPLLAAVTGRWSPSRVLIGALGAFGLVNLASALAPSYAFLVATRLLAGCLAAVCSPLASTIAVTLAPPEKRGRALAMVMSGVTLALVLGGPVGTWLGEHWGWRSSLGMVAAVAGLASLTLLLCKLPAIPASPTVPLKTRLAPLGQPRVLLALAPMLLWAVGFFATYTYLAPLLQQNLHTAAISGLLLAIGLGSVLGVWLGGILADRIGSVRSLVVGLVVLGLTEASLAFATTSLTGALPVLFIWSSAFAMLSLSQTHRMVSLAPAHANVILALNTSTTNLGTAAGAALGGAALHAVAVTQLGWVGAVCICLALLTLGLGGRVVERTSPRLST